MGLKPSLVSKQVADSRYSIACEDSTIQKIVRHFAYKLFGSMRSRAFEGSDFEQESWIGVWEVCLLIDPVEERFRFYGFLRSYLRNKLTRLLRYHYAGRRDPRKEVFDNNLVDENGNPIFETFCATNAILEERVNASQLLQQLQQIVVRYDDREVFIVFLTMIYPGPDIEALEHQYRAANGFSYTKRVPDEVYAEALGIPIRDYRKHRQTIRQLASEIGITDNRKYQRITASMPRSDSKIETEEPCQPEQNLQG